MITTWNPADKSAGVILSNNSLTAQVSAATGVRGTTSHSAGSWCFDIIHNGGTGAGGNAMLMGVANTTLNLNQDQETDINQRSIAPFNGSIYPGNLAYGTIFVTGDVIGVAVDLDKRTIKFSKNGVFFANGANAFTTLPNGALFPFLGYASGANNGIATLNCNPTTVPSGYTAWDGEQKIKTKQW